MRIPPRPPSLDSLIGSIGTERLRRIHPGLPSQLAQHELEPHGNYFHWEDLQHRTPPAELTLLEWWYLIKQSRLLRYSAISLSGREPSPNPNRILFLQTDYILEQLHKLTLRSGGMIVAPQPLADRNTRDQFIAHSLMEEAITSSQLEGASTTRAAAEEMIRSGRPPRDTSERMILNNYETMERIAEIQHQPMSRGLLLELHRGLTEGTFRDPAASGRFRRPEEKIQVVDNEDQKVLHVPPPAEELEARMALLCDFANEKLPDFFIPPVLRAILLHFWLAHDHPFIDGNGRTARALFYWSALRSGYWLFEFLPISSVLRRAPAQYGRAFLRAETDENDATYFSIHQLETIEKALKELERFLKRKSDEARSIEAVLGRDADLNLRQRTLLSSALRDANAVYTIHSHQVSHRVARETARLDLFDLKDRGLLVATKSGKTYQFRPAPDLGSKLAELRS